MPCSQIGTFDPSIAILGCADELPVGKIRATINRFVRRGDRGASGVEYALVVSLVLTGSTASFEMMDERIETHYSETANDIGRADLDHFNVTTTTCGDCATETTTTTTTTLPPTTTTQAPPTTTAAPSDPGADLDFTNLTYEDFNGWKAKTRIVFTDDEGDRLEEVDFQVTWVTAQGETRTKTYTTNGSGKKSPAWGGRDEDDFPIVMTIDWIDDDGDTFTPNPSTYEITKY